MAPYLEGSQTMWCDRASGSGSDRGEPWKKGEQSGQDISATEITFPGQTHQMVPKEVFNSR